MPMRSPDRADLRITHVSDTHLSPGTPQAVANWDRVVAHVEATRPDLVLNTGDITCDGARDPSQLAFARRQLDRLPVRWAAIPGNHDLGDAGPTSQPINDSSRRRYREAIGEANWVLELGGWRIVGVDIQLLLSPLPEAATAWRWLVEVTEPPGPTVLAMHRPLQPGPEHADAPHRYVTEPLRTRLAALMESSDIRLVLSGHVHQWRTMTINGTEHVWGPSTWATLPDSSQAVMGVKAVGIVEHELSAQGIVSTMVRPDGVGQHVIGVDVASPYG
jgi:3',5'-cyclic AMP phosphodiesterase CpdA